MDVIDETGPIATTDQFKAALLAARDWNGISPLQLQMLQLQCRAPDCTISAAALAEHLQLRNAAAARLRYGTFARAIAEQLGYTPPHKGSAAVRWWMTLSTAREGPDEPGDGHRDWTMRPELVAALRAMKWV
jgi:hypothetical protein